MWEQPPSVGPDDANKLVPCTVFALLCFASPPGDSDDSGGRGPPGLALETNQWTAQALSVDSPGWTLSIDLWVLASPGDPGWRRDSSPVRLAHMWAKGLVTGAHSVAGAAQSGCSCWGPPVQLGPLSGQTWGCDVSGVLMTSLERGRTGWLPQRHRGQTDGSLPSCLFSLVGPRIQKINRREALGQGRAP